MSTLIRLSSPACPKCKLGLDNWTVKAEVVDGMLGVRCPSCREFVAMVPSDEPITEKKEEGV